MLFGDATVVVPNASAGIASTEIQRYVVPQNVEFLLVRNGASINSSPVRNRDGAGFPCIFANLKQRGLQEMVVLSIVFLRF